MDITINLYHLLALILMGVLIYLIVVLLTPAPKAPQTTTVVDVVEEPRGWGWWPWNWGTNYGGGRGSYGGGVYFGPGKPCHGWFCGDKRADDTEKEEKKTTTVVMPQIRIENKTSDPAWQDWKTSTPTTTTTVPTSTAPASTAPVSTAPASTTPGPVQTQTFEDGPLPNLPIQTVEPPKTAEKDIAVALAETPKEIIPPPGEALLPKDEPL
jgi:hypothetical protein